MRRKTLAWACIPLSLAGSAMADTVTVRHDAGGDLGLYEVRLGVYEELGIQVRIDGVCASACTILTRLPARQICATRRAELRFHRTRSAPAVTVTPELVDHENSRLLSLYPAGIRAWIGTHGGLTDRFLTMPSETVAQYLRPCPPDTRSVLARGGIESGH